MSFSLIKWKHSKFKNTNSFCSLSCGVLFHFDENVSTVNYYAIIYNFTPKLSLWSIFVRRCYCSPLSWRTKVCVSPYINAPYVLNILFSHFNAQWLKNTVKYNGLWSKWDFDACLNWLGTSTHVAICKKKLNLLPY